MEIKKQISDKEYYQVERQLIGKVKSMIRKYMLSLPDKSYGMEDYLQEGRLAIYRAMLKHNPAKNLNVASYCLRGVCYHFNNIRRIQKAKKRILN
jgi:DNA-directed RNA polymerase specialized sigma subunit